MITYTLLITGRNIQHIHWGERNRKPHISTTTLKLHLKPVIYKGYLQEPLNFTLNHQTIPPDTSNFLVNRYQSPSLKQIQNVPLQNTGVEWYCKKICLLVVIEQKSNQLLKIYSFATTRIYYFFLQKYFKKWKSPMDEIYLHQTQR